MNFGSGYAGLGYLDFQQRLFLMPEIGEKIPLNPLSPVTPVRKSEPGDRNVTPHEKHQKKPTSDEHDAEQHVDEYV